ncbi:WhiB family transcriptional regulator [Schaalia sp. ZJ405]|uniref:WhiB family transcriptional regulator n=1 Tax=unclassified Schaalia TaxID=2691889 RepID=UPI0013ECD6BC|nr:MULTISPECIES: WhiB family transcriptional regulator [unclassified Schaalia]QPK81404.1 WhiB family transcriptional regulator [Schaalia sp. ZJ405]
MTSVVEDQSWVAKALCAGYEPDALFVQGATQRQVRLRCLQCEVRLECLADALESEANFGVWGGLTERERRAMLRHYTDVTDWGQWLATSTDPLAVEIRAPKVPKVLSHVRG